MCPYFSLRVSIIGCWEVYTSPPSVGAFFVALCVICRPRGVELVTRSKEGLDATLIYLK